MVVQAMSTLQIKKAGAARWHASDRNRVIFMRASCLRSQAFARTLPKMQ
jgi:hypothetical protein